MNAGAAPIRYGMFIMPFHPPDKPLAQGYEEDLELIVRAEELGFDEFWIGEHHTMKYENDRDARDLHRPGLGRNRTNSAGACSGLLEPTSSRARCRPVGDFWITCPRAGSIFVSVPAA